jgi:triphosphatase
MLLGMLDAPSGPGGIVPEPREIELKLDVDPTDVAALKARVLPGLGTGGETQHLVSVYYDTPEQALRKHGMTLRLRVAGERRVQTLKAGNGKSAGLFDRSEWETEVQAEQPDLAALAHTPAHRILGKARGTLEPVFETTIDRTLWTVETDRSCIELALDEGQVAARGRVRALTELEMELKRGTPADLFDLLSRLGEAASLRIGVLAKSERGYRLGKKEKPTKAASVALEHGMSTAAAFRGVMHACLRQFRLNEPLVIEQRAPEGLHQARVGMRRLRSGLSLFAPVIADDRLGGLKDGLRALSRKLGDARNLDVYLAHTARPESGAQGPASGATDFLADLEARRMAAYDAIEQALRSGEVRRLMLDLLAWIEGGPWLTSDDPLQAALREQPVEHFAAHTLEARRRKLKKKGRRLETLDPTARHRVRIEAKKLRYAADFFASLAVRAKERDRHAAFVESMEKLQQHLGELNDISTGDELARSVAAQSGPHAATVPEAFVAGHASGMQDARSEALLHAAGAAYRDVVDAKRFWVRWAGQGTER